MPNRPPHLLAVGLTVLDLVHHVTTSPAHNEKVTANGRQLTAGGPATNAALTFAALGGEVTLVSAVGDSALSSIAHDEFKRYGVQLLDVCSGDTTYAPNISAVTVNTITGDRSVVSLDAVNLPTRDNGPLVKRIAQGVASGVYTQVLIDGHLPEIAQAVTTIAADYSVPVIADAGRWKPQFNKLLPLIDELICSHDFNVPNGTGFDRLIARSAADGVHIVAQTHGQRPVDYAEISAPDGSISDRGMIPVPTIKVVDTLGAGDVFHGAYAYARGNSEPVPSAIAFASEVAALRCSVLGIRAWTKEPLPSLARRRQNNVLTTPDAGSQLNDR